MEILRYRPEHAEAVLAAIAREPEWRIFTEAGVIDMYRRRLAESIAYVCYEGDAFCGYLRAILDDGFAVYISELYVRPEWRSRAVGRSLIARVRQDYSALTVYALSDEDAYYEKLGYARIGSVFEIGDRGP